MWLCCNNIHDMESDTFMQLFLPGIMIPDSACWHRETRERRQRTEHLLMNIKYQSMPKLGGERHWCVLCRQRHTLSCYTPFWKCVFCRCQWLKYLHHLGAISNKLILMWQLMPPALTFKGGSEVLEAPPSVRVITSHAVLFMISHHLAGLLLKSPIQRRCCRVIFCQRNRPSMDRHQKNRGILQWLRQAYCSGMFQ